MDEDTLDLVRQLSTRAGMILEDTSAVAVLVGNLSAPEIAERLAQIAADLTRAMTIVRAAEQLLAGQTPPTATGAISSGQ